MRFLFTSGYGYWGNFKPTDLRDPFCKHQVGGGETSLISIARELAMTDNEVIVFYNTARPTQYEGVDYLPLEMFDRLAPTLKCDVLASWDQPWAFRFADQARCHIMVFQLNNAEIDTFDHAIDMYFHPSVWHLERFQGLYPEITRFKARPYLTNGVDPVRYAQQVARISGRVAYTSSPDRGLHHLLRIWPAIQAAVPHANLHVYYDMDKWFSIVDENRKHGLVVNTAERADMLRVQKAGLKEARLNVTFHGGVGQWELAQAQLASQVICYPCDPIQPTEGFSMSCLEALTAGCRLVTSDADALGELWSTHPSSTVLPIPNNDNDEIWVEAVVKALSLPTPVTSYPEEYNWRKIAINWQREIDAWMTKQ